MGGDNLIMLVRRSPYKGVIGSMDWVVALGPFKKYVLPILLQGRSLDQSWVQLALAHVGSGCLNYKEKNVYYLLT